MARARDTRKGIRPGQARVELPPAGRYDASMAPALLLAAAVAAGPAFVEDDYPKALAQAKKAGKLLFVDAWAPWCHTCVFMREHVLKTPGFAAFEQQLVFAGIDTEKAKNAAFLERFPVDVWPTLFFIDPKTEAVVLKWIGSADEAQMKALLAGARKADAAKVVEADEYLAKGSAAEAAERYLAAAKSGDASARAVLSMLSALYSAKRHDVCAKTAVEQLPALTASMDRVNALGWGLSCALELDRTKPEAKKALDVLVPEAKKAVAFEGVFADDVSGLYELLVTDRQAAKEDATALARDWLDFLEGAAARATTPAARAVFDPHRLSAALASKQPERVVAALTQSEKELPTDYNPPARLAVALRELGKLDEALAAADRALAKCKEGPRKLRLYETKASVLEKKGDAAARKKTLEAALAYAKALPKGQRSEARVAQLEEAVKAAAPAAPAKP